MSWEDDDDREPALGCIWLLFCVLLMGLWTAIVGTWLVW